MKRCINIDWLEVYCLEPLSQPRDADFFRRCGWHVEEREYGTPMYHEMFTLYDTMDYALIEIRRNPKSVKGKGGLFDINGCHVRLSNRTCYFDQPCKLLDDFLHQYGFVFSRISRMDVCLDFERFDRGDHPDRFMRRYMEGKFSKINQARVHAHGEDTWEMRVWNSLSWGHPKSMIRTRFYCKSLELQQNKDKPYIRQAWFAAGLVDNPITCEKVGEDGATYHPVIWRVEFAISSAVKRWFVINPDGNQRKYRSIRHTLDNYYTRDQLLTVFDSLQRHYFHFKQFIEGQRKDRCPDKVLFDFGSGREFYTIPRESIASTSRPTYSDDVLLRRLQQYQLTHSFIPEQARAAQIIIDALQEQKQRFMTAKPFSREQLTALRLAIARRMQGLSDTPMSVEIELEQTINDTIQHIFGER